MIAHVGDWSPEFEGEPPSPLEPLRKGEGPARGLAPRPRHHPAPSKGT